MLLPIQILIGIKTIPILMQILPSLTHTGFKKRKFTFSNSIAS
jgi:hypothetical protein